MRRLTLMILAGVCAIALVRSAGSEADVFAPIKLESSRFVPLQAGAGEAYEQAEGAEESVVSGNGQYIAFVGSFAGVQGIWRRDLQTQQVEQVAPGNAKLPSMSANGRYVSFTTTGRLDPEDDHNDAPDVYVRDMDSPCAGEGGRCVACGENEEEACPFILVSAVNGSREGPTYTYTGEGSDEEREFGSLASGRSAIDAEGEYVVFETAAESNLLGFPTPAREILLRDLKTRQTTLVSSEYDPQTNEDTGAPVPLSGIRGSEYGAAYRLATFESARFGGASISADGSTVAWLGQDIGRQVKLLPGEQTAYDAEINEPLWRRVQEGASAPTRRVTGFSEPESPACAASGQSKLEGTPATDPCQGPFAAVGEPLFQLLAASEGMNFVPQLSENGNRVAFLASTPTTAEVASGAEFPGAESHDDLYVAEIGGLLTRAQALRRLTEIAGNTSAIQLGGKIVDLAISPKGNEVAFTSERTMFTLEGLSYVSPIEPKAGINELYDADLADDTLTRVTHGYGNESAPSESAEKAENSEEASSGAASPSFDDAEEALSFCSTAYNLVYGDGNGASDAFLAERMVFAASTPLQYISNPPPAPALVPAWKLFVSATSEADGAVALHVEAPGAGKLTVVASSGVPVKLDAGSSRAARHSGRAATTHIALLTRTVASTAIDIPVSADGLQQLTLSLKRAYRSLAARRAGLYSAITLHFAAAGHPTLSASVDVTFRRRTPARRATRAAHGAGKHEAQRG